MCVCVMVTLACIYVFMFLPICLSLFAVYLSIYLSVYTCMHRCIYIYIYINYMFMFVHLCVHVFFMFLLYLHTHISYMHACVVSCFVMILIDSHLDACSCRKYDCFSRFLITYKVSWLLVDLQEGLRTSGLSMVM